MEANLAGDEVAATPRSFPPANWGPWVAVLGVIAALGTGVVLSIPGLLAGENAQNELSTLGNILVQIGTALGFLLVPMAIAASRGAKGLPQILSRLGVRRFSPSAFKWMAAAVGLYLVASALYTVLITEPHQKDIAEAFGPIAVQVVLIVILAPISEELCFRGMLYGGLRERLPRYPAALITGLIFGGLHATTGITAVPPLIVFGFLLALLYEKTGSIVPGIMLHMLNNIVALLGAVIFAAVLRRLACIVVAAASLLALPAAAVAAPSAEKPAKPQKPAKPTKPAIPKATVKIDVGHLDGGLAPIFSEVPVTGTLSPYEPGQRVEITFYLNGHSLVSHRVAVQPGPNGTGSFESSVILRTDGKYAVAAHHAATAVLGGDSTVRKSWRVSYPKLKPGECGKVVGGFKTAMAKMGYVSGGGECFNGRLGREVLAYRKVNGMDRTSKAGPGVVKAVFAGEGGYQPKYPDAGEHAEVSLDKQVLVLIKNGKPFAIYPVSTGKPSTPTITGQYQFYRQEPGYNSEGMYYSFYWHNGYAVHGYAEVPDYAASHGCVRTYIADQPRIYEQLHYGESIFVF